MPCSAVQTQRKTQSVPRSLYAALLSIPVSDSLTIPGGFSLRQEESIPHFTAEARAHEAISYRSFREAGTQPGAEPFFPNPSAVACLLAVISMLNRAIS